MPRSSILARFGNLALIHVGGGGGAAVDSDPRDCPPVIAPEGTIELPGAPADRMHDGIQTVAARTVYPTCGGCSCLNPDLLLVSTGGDED